MNHIYFRTAAALAAVAINEAFPGSEFLGGEATLRGFTCQFYYPFSLPPEALPMLEERMRQIVRENRPIKELEMVAYCAKELFLKLGHKKAVEALKDCPPKDLVSILQIGNFHELMDGPFCFSIRDVGAFKVTSFNFLGEGVYRVEGCAFATKNELKDYARKLSAYGQENHLNQAERMGLFHSEVEGILWREKGLRIKQNLVSFFKKFLIGEELFCTNTVLLKKYACSKMMPSTPFFCWTFTPNIKNPKGSEGFFDEECQSLIVQNIYCIASEMRSQLISLLQTIDKTLIILGFHAYIQFACRKKSEKALSLLESVVGHRDLTHFDGVAGARAQWMILDGLGREHIAFEIDLAADQSSLSLKVGIEKILALLLEIKGGCMPACLIVEDARVIALNAAQGSYASQIRDLLEKTGYRVGVDCRSEPLKARLADALKEGIPFAIVVGEKESVTNTVALRQRGSERSEPLPLSQLTERMKRTFDLEKTKY